MEWFSAYFVHPLRNIAINKQNIFSIKGHFSIFLPPNFIQMSSNGVVDDGQRMLFTNNDAQSNSAQSAKLTKTGVNLGQKWSPSQIRVYFAVNANLVRPWEKMFVCGNVQKLGEWEPEKAVEMDKEEEAGNIFHSNGPSSSSIWRSSIELDCAECRQMLKFRYFIGYRLQSDPLDSKCPKFLGISRWEAKKSPRCLLPSIEVNSTGECNREVVNEFGTYGGRHSCILDGWLCCPNQRQIMLRLSGPALKFFDPKLAQRQFLVRVTPFDVRLNQEFNFTNSRGLISWRMPSLYIRSIDEDSDGGTANSEADEPPLPSFSCSEFANLLDDDRPFFREQSPNGELYRNDEGEYFVFRTTSVATEFLSFRIELFMMPSRKTAGDSKVSLSPSRFALAYCMAASMPDTFGSLSLPLVAVKMQKPVGQIKIDYLLAKAMEGVAPPNLEVTFAQHWKKRKTIEVGHRGSGESFTKFASARENTIHSLNNAAQKGADFVEFDVQLSKDNSVVVFHDFHVLLSVAKRHQMLLGPPQQEGVHKSNSESDMAAEALAKSDLHQMAVRDLTLDQLRLLHIHHYKAKDLAESGLQPLTGDPNESPELRPFPTLVETLQRVDPHIGFNVELKYPMKLKDGSHECENYFERNEYVDRVLADVFGHSGGRRIVFSSFDPDICTLLALKQNKFPVLFLCVGETTRYIPFLDERSNLSRIGTNFAACLKLLGVNLHSEELLLDPGPLKRANALNLVVFVWGEDLANPRHVEYFRRQNVNAIIYDRIGEIEARQNVFLIEREAKNSLFKSPRSSPSPSPSRMNSLQKMALPSENLLSNGLTKQMTLGANSKEL